MNFTVCVYIDWSTSVLEVNVRAFTMEGALELSREMNAGLPQEGRKEGWKEEGGSVPHPPQCSLGCTPLGMGILDGPVLLLQ